MCECAHVSVRWFKQCCQLWHIYILSTILYIDASVPTFVQTLHWTAAGARRCSHPLLLHIISATNYNKLMCSPLSRTPFQLSSPNLVWMFSGTQHTFLSTCRCEFVLGMLNTLNILNWFLYSKLPRHTTWDCDTVVWHRCTTVVISTPYNSVTSISVPTWHGDRHMAFLASCVCSLIPYMCVLLLVGHQVTFLVRRVNTHSFCS